LEFAVKSLEDESADHCYEYAGYSKTLNIIWGYHIYLSFPANKVTGYHEAVGGLSAMLGVINGRLWS
jgi:hypothetical protein